MLSETTQNIEALLADLEDGRPMPTPDDNILNFPPEVLRMTMEEVRLALEGAYKEYHEAIFALGIGETLEVEEDEDEKPQELDEYTEHSTFALWLTGFQNRSTFGWSPSVQSWTAELMMNCTRIDTPYASLGDSIVREFTTPKELCAAITETLFPDCDDYELHAFMVETAMVEGIAGTTDTDNELNREWRGIAKKAPGAVTFARGYVERWREYARTRQLAQGDQM